MFYTNKFINGIPHSAEHYIGMALTEYSLSKEYANPEYRDWLSLTAVSLTSSGAIPENEITKFARGTDYLDRKKRNAVLNDFGATYSDLSKKLDENPNEVSCINKMAEMNLICMQVKAAPHPDLNQSTVNEILDHYETSAKPNAAKSQPVMAG